jgi:hypothetical protein
VSVDTIVGYTQPHSSKLVIDIPLAVWGLCFVKVGLYPAWLTLSGGIVVQGHSVPDPPFLSLQYLCCNSFCAGLSYLVKSPILSGVLCFPSPSGQAADPVSAVLPVAMEL